MPLPETGPVNRDQVKAYAQIKDNVDDARIDRIVDAVNALVRDLPIAQRAMDAPDWPARITEGAVMLAGRLWRRKQSPDGVAAANDFGPVYVQRNDPDIALMLEIGDHAKPAVG